MGRLYCSPVITLTVILFRFVEVNSIFASEWPVSQSVFENNDVKFVCEVRDKQDTEHLVWFSDMDDSDTLIRLEFANETTDLEYDNNSGKHSTEYELTSSNTHRLTYRIKSVKVADEGLYACGYIPLPIPQSVSRNNVLGDYANLQVLVPPTESKPKCTTNTAVITYITDSDNVLGMPLDLSCQITGGRPEPKLTWYRNNDSITSGRIGVNKITHVLQAADNGVEFTCVASGDSLQEDGSCSFVPLQIPPTATVSTSYLSMSFVENSDIIFTCTSSGLPSISKLDWFYQGQIVSEGLLPSRFQIVDFSDTSSELHLFDVKLSDNSSEVKCRVQVPSGLSNEEAVLVLIIPAVVKPDLTEITNNSTTANGLASNVIPIAASTSGFVLVLFIAIIAKIIYRRNETNNASQSATRSTRNDSVGYVIDQISPVSPPPVAPRSMTVESDPYYHHNIDNQPTATGAPNNAPSTYQPLQFYSYASNVVGSKEATSYTDLDLSNVRQSDVLHGNPVVQYPVTTAPTSCPTSSPPTNQPPPTSPYYATSIVGNNESVFMKIMSDSRVSAK